MRDFLRSNYEELILKLKKTGQYNVKEDVEDLAPLKNLLPWPIDAVIGFGAITYTLSLDVSLVDWLRDELGQWWVDPMHTFEDGMRMLPLAFEKKNDHGWNKDVNLSKNIQFGVVAREIHYDRMWCQSHLSQSIQLRKIRNSLVTW